MSIICGLINTPNLNFWLSSSKLKSSRSKRVSRTVLHKTQSWMHTTRLNLLMQRSNVHSKIQVVTHQYQRISWSQYLLQMQVQAQPKCSNALTQGKIPYWHTMVCNLKFQNQMQRSLSWRRAQCMLSHIGLPVFSNQHLFQLTQDQKGLFKACNGA